MKWVSRQCFSTLVEIYLAKPKLENFKHVMLAMLASSAFYYLYSILLYYLPNRIFIFETNFVCFSTQAHQKELEPLHIVEGLEYFHHLL